LIDKGKDERQNRDCHRETVAQVRRSSLLHFKLSFKFSVNQDAPSRSSNALASEWPLPVSDVLGIDTELVCVMFALYLLVEQHLPNAGSCNLKARYSINRIDRQAEAIGLVLDGKLQGRVDIPLFLITADMDVVLARAAISESVN
jgi:hypothetical protein